MKKIFNISMALMLLTAAVVLGSCSEDDDTSLTAVTNLTYEPTMGGAIIKFTAPKNNDLLYVKASYRNSLGNEVWRSTSIYDHQIEIDGLTDETKTYPIYISAVDKWGGETKAEVISVQPGRSYINIINDNLKINPMCGGLSIVWMNPAGVDNQKDITLKNPGKQVYIVVDYTDSANVTRTRYLTSRLVNATAKVRGLFAGKYNVSFHVEDFSGNRTTQSDVRLVDVPEETEFVKFTEREDPVNGVVKDFVWKLMPKPYTTLQMAWEYNNEAIFDGIIDSNTKDTRNYAGTACNASSNITGASTTYGSALPWDTEDMDIVVDLGQIVSISRLKAWQRCFHYGEQPYAQDGESYTAGISPDYDYYQPENLKHFKLFGSMTLNEDDWKLIQDCDIAENSTAGTLPIYWTNPEYMGQTNVYMPTNESYQFALDGHEWELSEMTDSVRYIRVRLVENWDLSKRTISGMSELTLYGELLVSHEQLLEQEGN